jgi:hypothetical protein
VKADLAQPMLSIKVSQHLHDICRNMNPGPYPLKELSLFINPHLEGLAL